MCVCVCVSTGIFHFPQSLHWLLSHFVNGAMAVICVLLSTDWIDCGCVGSGYRHETCSDIEMAIKCWQTLRANVWKSSHTKYDVIVGHWCVRLKLIFQCGIIGKRCVGYRHIIIVVICLLLPVDIFVAYLNEAYAHTWHRRHIDILNRNDIY